LLTATTSTPVVRATMAFVAEMGIKTAAATSDDNPASAKTLTMWNCSPVPSIEIEANPRLMIQKAGVRIASDEVQFSSSDSSVRSGVSV